MHSIWSIALAFLEIVRDNFPEFFNWVNCCYGSKTILDFETFTIGSAYRMQQGDPMGPCLFTLALFKLTAQTYSQSSLELWYCDVGLLVGFPLKVGKALAVIESLCPELASVLICVSANFPVLFQPTMILSRSPYAVSRATLSTTLVAS